MRVSILCVIGCAWLALTGQGLAGEPPAPSQGPFSLPSAPSTPALPIVPFEKLLPFLPEIPAGWAAEPPEGSTTDGEEIRISTAQRSYHKGDDEKAATALVSIIDSAGDQEYFDATTATWNLNRETTEGYDKGVEIDGMKGFEHYDKATRSSSLSVFVAKRYFVQVELTSLDPKELREWFKNIDVKKLALLK